LRTGSSGSWSRHDAGPRGSRDRWQRFDLATEIDRGDHILSQGQSPVLARTGDYDDAHDPLAARVDQTEARNARASNTVDQFAVPSGRGEKGDAGGQGEDHGGPPGMTGGKTPRLADSRGRRQGVVGELPTPGRPAKVERRGRRRRVVVQHGTVRQGDHLDQAALQVADPGLRQALIL
jgi:hypothetical protein